MTSITVDPRSAAELNRAFDRVVAVLASPRPVLDRIGAYQERQFAIAFEQNRSPAGRQWAPLAPTTLQRKQNSKPLVERVGRIPSSLFYEVKGNGSVEIGYADPLATIHHFGARFRPITIRPRTKSALYWPGARHPVKQVTIPARTLPARELVGASAVHIARWTAIANEEVSKAWNT